MEIGLEWISSSGGAILEFLKSSGRLFVRISKVLIRQEWEGVALKVQADNLNIEIICSDGRENRLRVGTRISTVSGLRLTTRDEAEKREYPEWTGGLNYCRYEE